METNPRTAFTQAKISHVAQMLFTHCHTATDPVDQLATTIISMVGIHGACLRVCTEGPEYLGMKRVYRTRSLAANR